MTGSMNGPQDSNADEPAAGARDERHARWMGQLQSMIDDLATAAAPTLREIGAKAAELAAKAVDAAGPIAQRAAVATSDVGQRLAARGREIATDLRRPGEVGEATAGTDAPAAAPTEPPTLAPGDPANDRGTPST
ncbi:MAG: hypothetical protein ACYDB6_02825 [Candidatus Limnocylindrales bacterium]